MQVGSGNKGRKNKKARKNKEKVVGTTERPRLSVYRSLSHMYAQIIDDFKGSTIAAASSLDKELIGKDKKSGKGNIGAAKQVGELIAKKALKKGIKRVVFDRGGYLYHGRVKALADAARENGLEF